MRDIYKILAMLETRGTKFCFQSQGNFYNLSVTEKNKPTQYFKGYNLDDVEKAALAFYPLEINLGGVKHIVDPTMGPNDAPLIINWPNIPLPPLPRMVNNGTVQ